VRFSISYRTEYRYGAPVSDQHNVLRVRPSVTSSQRVGRFRMSVEPGARLRSYTDYFGTEVVEFNVASEHDRLLIEAESEVETTAPPTPPRGDWGATRTPAYADAGGEFLLPTGDEPTGARLAELDAQLDAEDPLSLLVAICELINGTFEYRPGATFVGSTVDDLLAGGAGVCQDFAHVALILLRGRGVAARYVSGYLFATGDGRDSAEVNTHAWVEALIPNGSEDGARWVGADPTNRTLVGESHVKIGHGRHYGDVPPIRGVYRGAATASHDVAVRMTRIEAAA
jgi:transglutaminase-like putative cysteine protease